jgi:hypothetical protein
MGHAMKRIAFTTDRPKATALRALNYTPEIERIRRKRKSLSIPLSDLLSKMGPAYGTVFTRIDCAPENGVELLSQSDMFSSEPRGRVIRRDSMARPELHEIHRFDVLLAGAGTLGENELYGHTLIADGRLIGKYVGPDSMTLVFKEPGSDLAFFAYAFLASEIGVRAIRSTSYGTKILRFRNDLLGTLPVPLASEATVKRVGSLIRTCIDQREIYARQFQDARSVFYELPEMQEALAMCAKRQARAVMWEGPLKSLSAWNVASSGTALTFLRGVWRSRLGDALKDQGAFTGPRSVRIACERPHGIDFMSQRDVFLMRPIPRRIVRPAIPDRLLFVPTDAILAANKGQLSEGSLFGKVELASYAAHKCGVTEDILRLLPRDGHRTQVFTFLSTAVGQSLFKSTAVGTSIPSVRLDLLLDLPYPNLSDERRNRVEVFLSEAETARIAGTDAELEAIRIVEEEVLPSWLG